MPGAPDRLVLIGGGPSAVAAARAYREAGGGGEVRLLSSDGEPPYFRPPLSKDFLRGESEDGDLPIEPPEFYRDQRVEVSLACEATGLDVDARTVTTSTGEVIPYTACVLATGSAPVRPTVPGADHQDVLVVRSAADSRRLRDAGRDARGAVVVGAGFIGCEAAVSLARLGPRVTVLCQGQAPQHRRLGPDAGNALLGWLRAEGVDVLTDTGLHSVEDGHRVRTDTGRVLDTDVVLLATGARPRVDLAARAGLAVEDGLVRTDSSMRTSAPGVFAVGDVALAHNTTAGRPLAVEHWGEAENMGAAAGRTAAGETASWTGVPGFWSDIGDRTLKYAAWGDGFDEARFRTHREGFTVWYGRGGNTVGVLTHNADEDYERGTGLVEEGAPLP